MKKQICNYAFIDAQNFYRGIKNLGWKIDYRRFRIYLKEKYNVHTAFIFIGFLKEHVRIYNSLRKAGYILVFRPTVRDKFGNIKGNVDVELTIHVLTKMDAYHKAVIISGDGDFHSLFKLLLSKEKLAAIGIPNKRERSSLLMAFKEYSFYIESLRSKVELKTPPLA